MQRPGEFIFWPAVCEENDLRHVELAVMQRLISESTELCRGPHPAQSVWGTYEGGEAGIVQRRGGAGAAFQQGLGAQCPRRAPLRLQPPLQLRVVCNRLRTLRAQRCCCHKGFVETTAWTEFPSSTPLRVPLTCHTIVSCIRCMRLTPRHRMSAPGTPPLERPAPWRLKTALPPSAECAAAVACAHRRLQPEAPSLQVRKRQYLAANEREPTVLQPRCP